MQTPKDLKKTVWAEALLQGIEIDRENKRAGPCWTLKILLAQSKLIKLFSCKHIQTMYYRCCIVDFEWGGSIYSECLFCKGLRKWSVIFFFFSHRHNTQGPCNLTLDCVIYLLVCKDFFFFFLICSRMLVFSKRDDSMVSLELAGENTSEGNNNQVDCCDWSLLWKGLLKRLVIHVY